MRVAIFVVSITPVASEIREEWAYRALKWFITSAFASINRANSPAIEAVECPIFIALARAASSGEGSEISSRSTYASSPLLIFWCFGFGSPSILALSRFDTKGTSSRVAS